MRYYSTGHNSPQVSLEEAVLRSTAPDGGLYIPCTVPHLPQAFIRNMASLSLPEIGFAIANFAFQGDVEGSVLHDIVNSTLNFDIPIIDMGDGRNVMELFHGPTMAYKDIGVRFMAGLLSYFTHQHSDWNTINVLVPTSGDTGCAVANGFYNVPGVEVWILYPQDTVSFFQEAQFASLGKNVHAIEVNGTFDDCKRLVKQAFMDEDLNKRMLLTSATSINIARIIPQTFYYFYAYAQLLKQGKASDGMVVSVPCANLGNLASGLLAREMGLPVKRFISVENQNNTFYNYLRTGTFSPQPSVQSIAPALDAGNPTNFARIAERLGNASDMGKVIHGYTYDDMQIVETMREVYERDRYLLDPHSAIAYRALCEDLQTGETGIALATAHPSKFSPAVELAIGHEIELPAQLMRFMNGTRRVTPMSSGFTAFKNLLMGS